MGYNTRYKIEIISGELQGFEVEMLSRGFITLEKLISAEVSGKNDGFNLFGEPNKWYEHHEDMKKFSSKHPSAVFLLSGEGEESGDIWKGYYRNGKAVKIHPVLTWPEYDESKLT